MLKPKTKHKPGISPEPTGWNKVWQKVISQLNVNSALVLIATGVFSYLGLDMKGTQEKGVSQDKDWHTKSDNRWNRVDTTLSSLYKHVTYLESKLDSGSNKPIQ